LDDHEQMESPSLAFEHEKWQAEQLRLDREFQLRQQEFAFRQQEARRSRWHNPLAIAIFGAAIAAAGSAYVAWQNNGANLELEKFRAEAARIFEIIKTGNPDEAAKNLKFLIDSGLIQNQATVENLRQYLNNRKAGEGVALPAQAHIGQPWIGRISTTPPEISEGLRELGYYKGPSVNEFTPELFDAIRRFQMSNGIIPDGIFGPRTEQAMQEALKQKNSPQSTK
jgi:murein L,D-transpeptidase YcbB/YkuD